MLAVWRVLTFGKWPAEGRRSLGATAGRKVWRITTDKPGGEWVDANSAAPPREALDRSTLPLDSWTTSSMDLLDGVQIVEHDDPADAAGESHKPH